MSVALPPTDEVVRRVKVTLSPGWRSEKRDTVSVITPPSAPTAKIRSPSSNMLRCFVDPFAMMTLADAGKQDDVDAGSIHCMGSVDVKHVEHDAGCDSRIGTSQKIGSHCAVSLVFLHALIWQWTRLLSLVVVDVPLFSSQVWSTPALTPATHTWPRPSSNPPDVEEVSVCQLLVTVVPKKGVASSNM